MRRVVVMGCIAVQAGCSPGGGTGRSPEARRPSPPALTEAWRQIGIRPIGQPVLVGDTIVGYSTVDRDLYIYGVAVADGAIRWRQLATPSDVVSGVPVTPSAFDGRVAYFRPAAAGGLEARLVVAAPETGHDLLVSDPALFTSHPRRCDDKKDVCVNARDGRSTVSRRFSVDAGGPVANPGATPAGSRWLAEDLLDAGGRRPETLAGFQAGAVRWRSPLSRHFTAGSTTDRGWHFVLYRSAGVHVGSVGRPPDEDDGSSVVFDLSKDSTAAIDAASGSSAWRSEGSSFLCRSKIDVPRRADDRWEAWPVQCRYRGTSRYNRGTNISSYEGLDVTVEGFDVATGRTTWSVPLGAATGLVGDEAQATVVSEVQVLVRGGAGPVIIDVATGATRAPAVDETFWCEKNAWFEYRVGRQYPDVFVDTWRGGTLFEPCTADESPTVILPTDVPKQVGVTAGDRSLVATATGLVAYDRPR